MGAWKCPHCGREFQRAEQPHFCGRPATVDDYIAAQPEALQPKLQKLRAILRHTTVILALMYLVFLVLVHLQILY